MDVSKVTDEFRKMVASGGVDLTKAQWRAEVSSIRGLASISIYFAVTLEPRKKSSVLLASPAFRLEIGKRDWLEVFCNDVPVIKPQQAERRCTYPDTNVILEIR